MGLAVVKTRLLLSPRPSFSSCLLVVSLSSLSESILFWMNQTMQELFGTELPNLVANRHMWIKMWRHTVVLKCTFHGYISLYFSSQKLCYRHILATKENVVGYPWCSESFLPKKIQWKCQLQNCSYNNYLTGQTGNISCFKLWAKSVPICL